MNLTTKAPASVQTLKAIIHKTQQTKDLDILNDFIDELPSGSRFIIRPHKMTPILVMGWDNGLGGLKLTQRCRLVESAHSFPGIGFFFDKEGFLSLLGGTKPHQPWARLPFSYLDSLPAFDIAILGPDMPAHQAEYS